VLSLSEEKPDLEEAWVREYGGTRCKEGCLRNAGGVRTVPTPTA